MPYTNASTRREVLRRALVGAGALVARGPLRLPRGANDRLDIGVIGVGGRGAENLKGVAGENIVALCDVDERNLGGAAERFPAAARFRDFRAMIAETRLDAVVVSTADHTHALATLHALEAGCHVYCEKPLTHSVHEARVVTETAARRGAVTQLGTQIHAGSNYRRVVELVRAGILGPVGEIHVFIDKTWGGDGRPAGEHPVPDYLAYDLWLGPRAGIAYNPEFHPASWRRYWPFGGGTLSDMGCHYLDLPFWALGLRHSDRVETEGPPLDAFSAPRWIEARWRFPAAGTRPECWLHWYDGGRRPEELLRELGVEAWRNGVLFLGERGALLADYSRLVLLPEEEFAALERPEPTIPDSIGHHAEWIRSCKEGGSTTCAFDYSGPLTETVLLGNVAFRAGGMLEWDADALVARGPDGEPVSVRDDYRPGWELPGE